MLISLILALILFRDNLFEEIWFGFECDNKLFKENFIKVKTFITLKPELVEKKEPPSITSIRKTKTRLLVLVQMKYQYLKHYLKLKPVCLKNYYHS